MLLEAKNISFAYRRSEPILRDVSINVQQGERVVLVGPSGCGKSTLSLILAGYLKPYSGEVLLEGRPVSNRGFNPIQLIYQHPEQAVNPRWKLRDILYESWRPDTGFLAEMGIASEWLDRYPTELSGGELQRFCIARALAPLTRLIIADEMTTMLDVITQAQVWDLVLRQVEKRDIGLLAVTHNQELAARIATRVVLFEELSGYLD
jgi:peptide/nickel transport system ATP-binding protein